MIPYLIYTCYPFHPSQAAQASLLGGGFALSSFNPVDNNNDLSSITVAPSTNEYYDIRRDSLMGYIASTSECLGFVISPTMEGPNLNSIEDLQNSNNSEDDLYFYHTDHLGSSSWITDASGSANQHLQYLPYGEDYIYQRNNEWDVPYTFSGKEKDSETGYSYFGARYYDSDISVWLSVDPLASRFPNISGYAYVNNSPVMYTDPRGLAPDNPPAGANPDLYESNKTSGQEYRGNGNYTHHESADNSTPKSSAPTSGGQTSPLLPQSTTTSYRKLPAFSILESNYPKYGPKYPNGGVSDLAFANLAGGKVQANIESGVFSNTCALRISHALTESGESLPYASGSGNSSSNRDKKWYYPRVAVLSSQLNLLYGPPTVNNTSNLADLQGKKGIIIFHTPGLYSDASGHATLWNGSQALGGNHDYIPLLGNGVTASLWVTP